MAKSKLKAKLNKSRNPIANNTIMRKGGVHEKSRKAKRQKLKSELRNSLSKLKLSNKGHEMWPLFCPDVL